MWGCSGPQNDNHKTLVTNSADIQYAKWQHTAGIEKVFTYYMWRWSTSTWKHLRWYSRFCPKGARFCFQLTKKRVKFDFMASPHQTDRGGGVKRGACFAGWKGVPRCLTNTKSLLRLKGNQRETNFFPHYKEKHKCTFQISDNHYKKAPVHVKGWSHGSLVGWDRVCCLNEKGALFCNVYRQLHMQPWGRRRENYG